MAASAVLHVAFVTAVSFAAREAGLVAPARTARDLTFVRVLPAPALPLLRVPPVVKEEVKILEAPVAIETPPIPDRVMTRAEPTPPAPEPRPEPPIAPDRPRPASPTVTVGAFALNGTSTRAPERSRSVQPAEFDTQAARAPEIKTISAAVGAFEQSSVRRRPRPGTDRPNVVADAGFGTGTATGTARPGGRVADAGFGTGVATATARSGAGVVAAGGFDAGRGDAGRGAQPTQAVKATDFDTRSAQPAAPQAPRQAPTEVPLEILSKPTPTYTEEARALKIEGEVLLDVEFAATGGIRVLRVVRGLGHGLDESATRAVQGMRFKPAQRHGRAIDVRTTVNIVFRLA